VAGEKERGEGGGTMGGGTGGALQGRGVCSSPMPVGQGRVEVNRGGGGGDPCTSFVARPRDRILT
jgi:hypothetical protein